LNAAEEKIIVHSIAADRAKWGCRSNFSMIHHDAGLFRDLKKVGAQYKRIL
jgi:hypothetical protein